MTGLRPAVWFSRHTPTAEQIADARRLGYEIVGVPEGQALGAIDLRSREQALEVCRALRGLCAQHGARAVFGVFPTDILSVAYGNPGVIRLFAAANSRRSQEGGPVTFCHREWLQVGRLAARAVLR